MILARLSPACPLSLAPPYSMLLLRPARLPSISSSFSTCRDSIESALLLCDTQHDDRNYDDGSIDAIFLGGNHIGDRGVARIVDGLEDYIQYRKLYLCDNRISRNGVHLISQSLRLNKSLIELSLADNSIGDFGASLLATSLTENVTLKILNLENNRIGCEGTKSIAGAMMHNTVLQYLVLSENPIGDDGARALLRCIFDTASLKSLHNSNHTIISIILKKATCIKDGRILRDIKTYLKVNRVADNLQQLAAKRKIISCIRENPLLLTRCNLELVVLPHVLSLLASQLDLATMNVILKLLFDQVMPIDTNSKTTMNECIT